MTFALAFVAPLASATPTLIAIGTLGGASDLSGLTGTLESGVAANVLGGIGSGLAWAGGNTFLALPDRGPNATAYAGGSAVDNTTSYIPRFQTLTLDLAATGGAYTLTPTLTGTTLLYSPTSLDYGNTVGLSSAVPAGNGADKFYFSGRSDNFAAGLSTNSNNARLDPEGIRVSNDGKSVFISDEYGPYVYQFDRATGQRTRVYDLSATAGTPGSLAASNLGSTGASEISGNTSGRVANKGMEGLAITPDGKTLVGFMQSPLVQDGGDGGRANRMVTIDIATGAVQQYAYDNRIGAKNYNSSEILALNSHQFLVLERDGKGRGDGSAAKIKQIWAVDMAGAVDVSNLSGEAALLAKAPSKVLFLDLVAALKAFGLKDTEIPAKLEGLAFGEDFDDHGVMMHTLYLANDNDFLPDFGGVLDANPNEFFVFSFSDADLARLGLDVFQRQSVSEPGTLALMLGAFGLLGGTIRRRR